MIHIFKGTDGLRKALLVSSNAYEDRDEEIVKEAALKDYVENFTPTPLLFWHGGQPIGKVIDAQMVGPFMLELAKELPNKVIDLARPGEPIFLVERRHVWDMIEEHKGEWGVSIGFQAKASEGKAGEFDNILKFESSLLPRTVAANAFTYAAV